MCIRDRLTSEHGEKFSAEAAQYAVDNLNADYNENALAKAKSYQEDMSMSPDAIKDQLTSEYGEKFTQEEADYAIQHLNE
ncbi:Ltp family lipoprotein, partial [Enterococcus sp. S157_ASV_20]|nr:Ltp family lipoprotein [Enterococcus sp. S157_ASV_20]